MHAFCSLDAQVFFHVVLTFDRPLPSLFYQLRVLKILHPSQTKWPSSLPSARCNWKSSQGRLAVRLETRCIALSEWSQNGFALCKGRLYPWKLERWCYSICPQPKQAKKSCCYCREKCGFNLGQKVGGCRDREMVWWVRCRVLKHEPM